MKALFIYKNLERWLRKLIFGVYKCRKLFMIGALNLIFLHFFFLPNYSYAEGGKSITGGVKKLYGIDVEKLKVRTKKVKKKSIVKKVVIETYKFSVDVFPENSIIKIMNIRPKYKSGIKLKPGKYKILVKKKGFKTYIRWIEIFDKDLTINVSLKYSTDYKKSGVWKQKQLNRTFFNSISKDTCADKTAVTIEKRGIVKGNHEITERNLKILAVIFKNCTLDSKSSKKEFCKNYKPIYINKFCTESTAKEVKCIFFQTYEQAICGADKPLEALKSGRHNR